MTSPALLCRLAATSLLLAAGMAQAALDADRPATGPVASHVAGHGDAPPSATTKRCPTGARIVAAGCRSALHDTFARASLGTESTSWWHRYGNPSLQGLTR